MEMLVLQVKAMRLIMHNVGLKSFSKPVFKEPFKQMF